MTASMHSRDHEILALLHATANVRYNVDKDLRIYHSLAHALSVMDAVQQINPDAPLHLVVAALYHDAVYVPGAGKDANELCSAAALAVDWDKCRFDKAHPVLLPAQDLIRRTSVNSHLSPMAPDPEELADIATLLDADLSALASDLDVFVQLQCCIIAENGGIVDEESLGKCAAFLKQFLEVRDNIYHTEYARTNWEAKARFNIQYLIDEFLPG
jgi:predicted metal-dependent HD superfamily phosphohydrolase